MIPSRELTYPTHGKRKISFNSALGRCSFPGGYKNSNDHYKKKKQTNEAQAMHDA